MSLKIDLLIPQLRDTGIPEADALANEIEGADHSVANERGLKDLSNRAQALLAKLAIPSPAGGLKATFGVRIFGSPTSSFGRLTPTQERVERFVIETVAARHRDPDFARGPAVTRLEDLLREV